MILETEMKLVTIPISYEYRLVMGLQVDLTCITTLAGCRPDE